MDNSTESSYIGIMSIVDLKHGQRERLLFLEKQFVWTGRAKRKHLIDHFGISMPQAALDFKEYISRLPENALRYDASIKAYFLTPSFKPLVPELSLDPAHSLLMAGLVTSHAVLPTLNRQADPTILARLNRAISNGETLSLRYISMISGDVNRQKLAPTRFASDGTRIHFRAYSFKHNEYRDYLPARISEIDEKRSAINTEPLPYEEDWHKTVLIWLKPKASLSEEQRAAVEREYELEDGFLVIPVRKALEFYADRRWGLDMEAARLERAKTVYLDIDFDDYVSA